MSRLDPGIFRNVQPITPISPLESMTRAVQLSDLMSQSQERQQIGALRQQQMAQLQKSNDEDTRMQEVISQSGGKLDNPDTIAELNKINPLKTEKLVTGFKATRDALGNQALDRILPQYTDQEGKVDTDKVNQALIQSGHGSFAQQYQKEQDAHNIASAKRLTDQLDAQLKQTQVEGELAGAWSQVADKDKPAMFPHYAGLLGISAPEIAKGYTPEFDQRMQNSLQLGVPREKQIANDLEKQKLTSREWEKVEGTANGEPAYALLDKKSSTPDLIDPATHRPYPPGVFKAKGPTSVEEQYMDAKRRDAAGKATTDDKTTIQAYEHLKTIAGTNTFNLANPGGTEDRVRYIADQAIMDKTGTILNKLVGTDKKLREQVVEELRNRGADLEVMTAMNRQLGESSRDLLPSYDHVLDTLKDPKVESALGAIGSRWQAFARGEIGTSDPALRGLDKDTISKINKLQTEVRLIQSGTSRAHFGSRGAAGAAVQEKFDRLFSADRMDAQTLKDGLEGTRDFLKRSYVDPMYGPGKGAKLTPNAGEKTATGPGGHLLILRGGKWLDSVTGNPIP